MQVSDLLQFYSFGCVFILKKRERKKAFVRPVMHLKQVLTRIAMCYFASCVSV